MGPKTLFGWLSKLRHKLGSRSPPFSPPPSSLLPLPSSSRFPLFPRPINTNQISASRQGRAPEETGRGRRLCALRQQSTTHQQAAISLPQPHYPPTALISSLLTLPISTGSFSNCRMHLLPVLVRGEAEEEEEGEVEVVCLYGRGEALGCLGEWDSLIPGPGAGGRSGDHDSGRVCLPLLPLPPSPLSLHSPPPSSSSSLFPPLSLPSPRIRCPTSPSHHRLYPLRSI